MNTVDQRAARLRQIRDQVPLQTWVAGLAQSCGMTEKSVQKLAELWLESLADRPIARWLDAMLAGDRQPIGVCGIVAPGNLFVATWTAMLEPWLCGNDVRVRPSSGDPLAAGRLAGLLGGDGFEIHAFDRGDADGWRRFCRGCAAMAAYGGDEAIAAVGAWAAEAGLGDRFRGHGDRVSIASVRAMDARAAAGAIALDAYLADGRGCMSLRALLVDDPALLGNDWADSVLEAANGFCGSIDSMELAAKRRLWLEEVRVQAALGQRIRVVERGPATVVIDERVREYVSMADVGPGLGVLVVLKVAPLSTDLRQRLAHHVIEPGALGRMQAPPIWRDPDRFPVGRVFTKSP